MKNSLANHVMQKISEVNELYFRLILLVGPSGCGKTKLLQELSTLTSAPLINVNLELSRVLLDLSERQRVLQLARILSKIVAEQAPRRCSTDVGSDLVLLDNIEILFDRHLKQDPLRLLQGLSRNKTIIATWNGNIKDGHIIYAEAGHPEYRRYPACDFLSVSMDVAR